MAKAICSSAPQIEKACSLVKSSTNGSAENSASRAPEAKAIEEPRTMGRNEGLLSMLSIALMGLESVGWRSLVRVSNASCQCEQFRKA